MALIHYDLAAENDKLQGFLMTMMEEETDFIERAQEQGYRLDDLHSLDSLEELERYVREQKVTFTDSSDEALDQRTNCWFYLGELVRQNFGGFWRFSMNQDNTMNWGAYVIEGHSPVEGVELNPLKLLKGFILRGCRAEALRKAIMADVKPTPFNFDNYPTESE